VGSGVLSVSLIARSIAERRKMAAGVDKYLQANKSAKTGR
jgi:hypothetical protein